MTISEMPPPVAPDGGFWAYMAVFGCFMGNVIGDGVMYRSISASSMVSLLSNMKAKVYPKEPTSIQYYYGSSLSQIYTYF